jgi:FO synthase
MAGSPELTDDDMVRTVALARLILGGEMNLQAPPNLSPSAHARLIRAGINDWGGISPLTMDYVNPEAPWPHVAQLGETCRAEGFELRPRLPIYPEYVDDEFVDPAMRSVIESATEETAGGNEPAGAMA